MLFLNTLLALGALGILIPIVIHLLNRQSNRVVDWGAMNFLLESLAIRNRRIQLEEALLMAARCLLVGLLALAIARPFIPPGSTVPWLIVLPLLLLGVVGIGVAVVLHNEPKWRFWIGLGSLLLLLLCVALIFFEKYLNLSRFTPGARQDIAVVIDGSTSMTMASADGVSNFDRAVEEARTLIKRAPRGHAFSLILAGPSPSGRILDPTTDRGELDAALSDLSPLDGSMATYHALTLASLSLAQGDNPAKQIILFTDEQDVGWESGKTGRWNFLRDAFRNLPSEPQIMMRRMPLPAQLRNLAITDLRLSREIVGVDRPVEVSVTVENTGNEAVTPGALVLKMGENAEQRDQTLGQIQPGERQTVNLFHSFAEPGAQSITAVLEVGDDIEADNRSSYALNVARELRVLIVNGRPSSRFFAKASSFATIALAPSSLTVDPDAEANRPSVTDEASDDFDPNYDPTLDPVRFLVAPKVVDAPDIGSVQQFDSYDVVLLADVARLPEEVSGKLRDFVEEGGGLFVVAGQKAQADFYNQWMMDDEIPFLPAKLDPVLRVAAKEEIIHPSTRTLTHPALQKIADDRKSDFSSAIVTNYRRQAVVDVLEKETSVGARLNNGDILLSSRAVGKGNVVLLGAALDASSGNLVTRQAFLPMVHELVYYLANPASYNLNLEPGWEVNIGLTAKNGGILGAGLVGNYYRNHSNDSLVFSRIDPALQFDWRNGSPGRDVPADGFMVVWTGKLQAPQSGRYEFSADVDDDLRIWMDDKQVGHFRHGNSGRKLVKKLEGNKWYDFRAELREGNGDAKAILYWKNEHFGRQIIPSKHFRSFVGDSLENEERRQTVLAQYEVEGPDGRARTAQLNSAGEGTTLKLQGDISSGLYQLKIPEEQRLYFQDFLKEDAEIIPFTVNRDEAESHLTRLTEADYAFLDNFVTISKPQTLEEMIGFLNGNQFGQELWKYLAVGAFFFLLLEIALSRWIARSRRMGEEITIDFESKEAPTAAFREQLAKIRG